MNSLNSVLVEGNLTADPEIQVLENGSKICTFTLASNRFFRKDDVQLSEVSFFSIEVWNRTADLCIKTLTKGRGVRVVGRLKQDRWEGPDGAYLSRVKIVGETVEFKRNFDKKPEEIQVQEP